MSTLTTLPGLTPMVHLSLVLALSLAPMAPTQAIVNDLQDAPAQTMLAGGPLVTATKTDALVVDNDGDLLADAGDALRYTVVVSNTGTTDALGVVFSDTLDANTVLSGTLRASPLAVNDVYTATQDTPLTVGAAGVLTNDFGLPAPTAVTQASAPTAQGGVVTLNADGSFTYTPPPGFTGADTFSYTNTNSSGSDSASVTLAVLARPVANDDGYNTVQNTPLSVPAGTGVLANDVLNSGGLTGYAVTTTQGGSVTLNPDGSFVYTPTTGFFSPPVDTFTYTVGNAVGSDTATVSITVNLPAPPTAVDDVYTATANTTLNVPASGVLANDTVNAATISGYQATTTQGGSITLNADGSLAYTPPNNFISPPTDTFTYTLTNALGSSTATVSLTVIPAGPPITVGDAYTTTANTPLTVTAPGVLGNDTLNFGVISAFAATTTQGGNVTLNPDGSFIYTPTLNFVSPPTDTFTYTLTNGLGSSTATVSLTVNPPGQPSAVGDVYTATVNTPLTVSAPGVLGNDTANFGMISAYAATTTQGGAVTLNPDGSFSYTPTLNFVSPPADTFTYTLSNALGNSTATVVITVNPAGAPVAVGDGYTATVDTPLNIAAPGVLGNDTLNFGGLAAYAPTTIRGGSVTLNSDGSFIYTPPAGVISPPNDTFTYTLTNTVGSSTATVTFTLNPAGPPVAVNDSYTATANTPKIVAAPGVLGNDTTNFGAITNYQSLTARGGSVVLAVSGAFTYTPPASTISPPDDTFTYTLSNVLGNSIGTVSMTIDPPAPPVAVNDTYTATADTPLTVSAPGVLGNDTLNFASLSSYQATTTRGGSVTLAASGAFTYTPPAATISPPTDSFTYTLSNVLGNSTATVTLNINPPGSPIAVNDAYTTTANTPLNISAPGVLSNDTVNFATISGYAATTTRGGAVTLNGDGSFGYIPPSNVVSPPTDTFTYTLTNGLGSSTGAVVITINPPAAPIAVNDSYTTTANTPKIVAAPGVLGNDTTNFGAITNYQSLTTRGGSVVLAASGAFTYTPPASTVSPPNDTFTYTIGNLLGSSTATVAITIDPPGPPIAVADSYTATQNTTRAFAAPGVLGNDTVNFAAITNYQSLTAQGGTITMATTGAFTYTPPVGFVSPPNDTFTYTLSNALGASTATASITVFPPPPDAVNDAYNVTGNIQISVPASGVLGNDTLNTATISFSPTVSTLGGNVAMSATGAFTYNPPAGFEGTDTFTYTLTNITASDTATVTLTITDVVWFVDNTAGAGSGRLGTPYNSLASLQGGDLDESGDVIFVYQGSGNYTGGLPLEASQALIGQGVSLSSALMALGITLAPNSAALPSVASNPTIINAAGNALTLSTNNTVRGVTLGQASGASLSGSSFGTFNADTVTINNTTATAITLTTGTANVTFASVSSSGGVNGVNLNGIAGTLTLGTGALSGATGATFTMTGGTASVTYSGNLTQANNAALVSVNGGHATGTLTFQTGTLNATNGTGLQFDNADGTYNFNGTNTLNGGDAGLDILNGSGGTFMFSSNTSITNPSGTAFNISTGTPTVTYPGTVSKTSAGRLVDIQSRTGNTVTLSGNLTCNTSCTGINVASNSGGTVTFSGTSKSLSTGANAGVTLSSNTGATITFSGGGLVIATTSGAGFTATGGGTVNVMGTGNTLASTTGTALNVTSTTIGASGLTFQSISANGGAKGIVLNSTGASGGLSVTGTGATDGSGGTIQNTTTRGAEFISTINLSLKNMTFTNACTTDFPAGPTGLSLGNNTADNAVIHLQNVTTAALDNVDITGSEEQGINGHNVSSFSYNNSIMLNVGNGPDEDGLHFYNMVGTSTINNTTITSSGDDNVNIQNNNNLPGDLPPSTIGTITINGGSANTGQGSGYLFGIRGTMNTTIDILNVTSNNNFSGGVVADSYDTATMNLEVTGSTITNNNDAIQVSAHNGNADFDIHDNNPFTGQDFLNITLLKSAFSTAGSLEGFIRNNSFTVANDRPTDSILVFNAGGAALNVVISNNTFNYRGTQRAIAIQTGQDGSGAINATITGNTIDMQLDGTNNAVNGIFAQSGITSPGGDGSSICADIGGAGGLSNTFTHSLGGVLAGGDIRVRQRNNGTGRLPGYAGSATDTAAIIAYLNGRNAEVSASTATVNVTGFAGGAACTQPTLLAVPQSQPTWLAASSVISANVGTLPTGKAVTLTFEVTIANPLPLGVTQVSNQGSVSGSNFSTVPTDDPDTGAANDPTITPVDTPSIFPLYLPIIARNSGTALAPDLIGTFSLSPNQTIFLAGQPVTITVTLTNVGNAPASNFWADFYINPTNPPTAGNQPWDVACGRPLDQCFGIAWFIPGPLNPGQSLTLTSTPGSYFAANTVWPGYFPGGTTDVYVYVDSYSDVGLSTGAILEGNETNNRAELHGLVAPGASAPAVGRPAELPPRKSTEEMSNEP